MTSFDLISLTSFLDLETTHWLANGHVILLAEDIYYIWLTYEGYIYILGSLQCQVNFRPMPRPSLENLPNLKVSETK
jgi:hypothetical protein